MIISNPEKDVLLTMRLLGDKIPTRNEILDNVKNVRGGWDMMPAVLDSCISSLVKKGLVVELVDRSLTFYTATPRSREINLDE